MDIQWRDDLLTGIKEIDDQHKELFKIAGEFINGCDQGGSKEDLSGLLIYLDNYALYHFNLEEELQEAYNYPDYGSHKAAHEEFRKNLFELKRHYEAEGATTPLVLLANELVVAWFIQHIALVDKKLCSFLKEKVNL